MNDPDQAAHNLLDSLTPREAAILALMVENKTNHEIAAQETLALSSVKWYINQIFSKLGVKTRAEAIAQARLLGLAKSGAPLPANNLPRQLTSFIGREREISRLLGLIYTQPLVTVTGAGGCGKTRLALRTAEKALAYFPDGVWLVELAPLANSVQVPQAVTMTLGLVETRSLDLRQALIDFLRPRQALLVLDNCEHLIGAVAGLVQALLRDCQRLHVLATSREILGVQGETAFRCPSLDLPDPTQPFLPAELARVEAIHLFCERAQSAAPGFALDETNAAQVTRICSRLDGIPLAIELAAARLRLLTIEQIAARLDDTFRLLTGGSRTELPRHQTLKALIDWSYNLLSPPERLLLQRLSVFAGGWTLEAAEQVCSDPDRLKLSTASAAEGVYAAETIAAEEVLDLLGQLMDKSLVGLAPGLPGDLPRYRMLETIRQYARDRLMEQGGGATVREQHLDYYLALCKRADPQLRGPTVRAWRALIDLEMDNLRLALEWALSGPVEKGLELAVALTWYWTFINRCKEGVDSLERLLVVETAGLPELRSAPARRAIRARALTSMALVGNRVLLDRATPAREACGIFAELGQGYELDWARAAMIGDIDDLPKALEVYRKLGDPFEMTEVLWELIVASVQGGQLGQARAYAKESLALYRQISYVLGEGFQLQTLGWLEALEGNLTQMREYYQEGYRCIQAAGESSNFSIEGWIALIKGDYESAEKISQEMLSAARKGTLPGEIASALGSLARINLARGQLDLAEQQAQEALRLAGQVPFDYLIDASLVLAMAAMSHGDYQRAFAVLQELRTKRASGVTTELTPVHWVLRLLGVLATAQEQHRRAAVLFGAQDFIAKQLTNISSPPERESYRAALAATRAELGEAVFAEAFAEGKAMSLEQALTYAKMS